MSDDGLLSVTIEHVDGDAKALLRVEGDVDVVSAGDLGEALEHVIANGATDVRLDLAGVPFLDSTGLTVLLTARTQLEDRGTVVVEAASHAVQRTFEVAGLDGVFGPA